MIFARQQSNVKLIIISAIMSEYSRRIQSCCNFEQAKENLITFVLLVKATKEPEHQCRIILGLDFEQRNRDLADPLLSQWIRCHQITSWKLLVSSHLLQCV